MKSGRWRQCPDCHKLIPIAEWDEHRGTFDGGIKNYYVQGDIESFVSPIDKSIIADRKQLREHNKKHGVTDSRDYSPEFFDRKHKERSAEMTGATAKAKKERIQTILDAIEKHGGH